MRSMTMHDDGQIDIIIVNRRVWHKSVQSLQSWISTRSHLYCAWNNQMTHASLLLVVQLGLWIIELRLGGMNSSAHFVFKIRLPCCWFLSITDFEVYKSFSSTS